MHQGPDLAQLRAVLTHGDEISPKGFCTLVATAIEGHRTDVWEIISCLNPQRVIERNNWILQQPADQQLALANWEMQAENSRYAWGVAASDAIAAMCNLLRHDGEHPCENSYLTLARVVIESAVNYCHITDRSLDFNEALLRHAAMSVEEIRQGNLVGAARDLDDEATLNRRTSNVQTLMDGAGITYTMTKPTNPQAAPKRNGVQRDGLTVPLQFVTTEAAEKILQHPSSKAPYRVGSAAAHAAWWFITQDHPQYWPPTQKGHRKVLEAATLTIDALTAMARAWDAPENDDRVRDVVHAANGRITEMAALMDRMPKVHHS